MRKICVSLTKGGVGKTTTSVHLATGIAAEGFRVLLVDTDTQGHAGKMLGVQGETGLADLLTGDASLVDAVVPARDNLFVLPGSMELAGAKTVIARRDIAPERTLSEALRSAENDYDFVIVDTAPGWDVLSINTLMYAGEVITPVSLEILTVHGLVDFLQHIERVKAYNPNLSLRYVVPTFYDRRVKKSDEILGQLQARFGDLLTEPIRYNVRLSEAPAFGQTVYEYAPESPAATDYRKLVQRVLYHE